MKLPARASRFVLSMLCLAVLGVVGVVPDTVSAQAKIPIHVAIGYAKGNNHFNIVVGDGAGTKLELYVNDAHPTRATANKQNWATFLGVTLTGTGKLSFTQALQGSHGSYQRPINYTQRYTVANGKVSFSNFTVAVSAAAVSAPSPIPSPSPVPPATSPSPVPMPVPIPSPVPIVAPVSPPTPVPTPVSTTSPAPTGCTNGTYVNVSGNTVCSPETAATTPAGATAQCNDGTYSFSQHHRGTCSGHGGVERWL